MRVTDAEKATPIVSDFPSNHWHVEHIEGRVVRILGWDLRGVYHWRGQGRWFTRAADAERALEEWRRGERVSAETRRRGRIWGR